MVKYNRSMTYLTIKIIKGNPYLYEVRSEREGDKVRQVFVRYLGRADNAKNIALQAGREMPVSVEPERIVAPTVLTTEAVSPPMPPEPVVTPEVTPMSELSDSIFDINEQLPRIFNDIETRNLSGEQLSQFLQEQVTSIAGADPTIRIYRGIKEGKRPIVPEDLAELGVGKFWGVSRQQSEQFAGEGGEVFALDVKLSELLNEELAFTPSLRELNDIVLKPPLQSRAVSITQPPATPEPVEAPKIATQQKEPWEMTRREFKISDYAPKVIAIQQAIRDGKPIILTTHLRATSLIKPEHIRLSGSTVQIPQGSKWVSLTDDQVQSLAGQAGINPVPFEEKVYHQTEVEQALSEGKPVPSEVLKDYPKLAPSTTTPEESRKFMPKTVIEESVELPIVGETVSGLTVRHEIPNQASIESSLEDYEILPGIREIPTSETGEITQPKFYSVEQEEVTRKLAEEIKASGEISPLILVITDTGDYILEGSHRIDALRILGIKSFPASSLKELKMSYTNLDLAMVESQMLR